MPHISRKEIEAEWLERMSLLFFAVLAELSSARARKVLLQELLTDTEQLMLAKRVALVAMIAADFSSYTIRKRLGISTGTVRRFARLLDRGGYKHITAELQKLREKEAFWETLEKISRGGLPPIVGKTYRPTLLRKRPRKR